MTDDKGKSGHPLPASEEAREDLVPEHLIDEKGHGDDRAAPSAPQDAFAAPDGTPYPGGAGQAD